MRHYSDAPLKFDRYTLHVGMGGYDYLVRREPVRLVTAEQNDGLTPVVLGDTHAVYLNDEKNSWYIGHVRTYQQALTLIGFDLMRHAGEMAEMSQYDTEPTTYTEDSHGPV